MKNLKKLALSLSLFAFVAASQAETYYFDTGVLKNSEEGKANSVNTNLALDYRTVSVTNGTTKETEYLWYTLSATGEKQYIKSNLPEFTVSDDLVFTYTSVTQNNNSKLAINSNLKVNTISSNMNYITLISQKGSTIETVGDFYFGDGVFGDDKYTDSNSYTCYYGAGNTIINGNLYLGRGSMGAPDVRRGKLDSLYVKGLTTIVGSTNNRPVLYVGKGAGDVDTPDAVLQGGITATSKQNQTANYKYDGSPLTFGMGGTDSAYINQDSFVWVNGVTGTAGFLATTTSGSTGNLTLVFTNDGTGSTSDASGNVSEAGVNADSVSRSSIYQYSTSGSKIALEMKSMEYTRSEDGSYTFKKFTNCNQTFLGEEMSFTGGVKMVSGGLFLNYNARGASNGTGAEVAKVSHGVLTLAQGEGAQTVFGNANEACGTFVFDSIAVKNGGTIKVNGSGIAGAFDILEATDGISGTGTITLSFADSAEFKYEGDGDSSGWYKVIAWAEGKTNTANVIAEEMLIEDGQYEFKYDNRADGLYVAYVVVPEPSTYAVIFGLLALGFALYHRRK